MFAGLLGLGLAIAGTALVVSSILPPQWRPFPLGDVPGGWAALQARWATPAALGTLVLIV
jgi:hypothetical protein